MRRPLRLSAIVFMSLLPSLARADWPADGKFVMRADDSFNTTRMVRFFDFPGGDIVVLCVGGGGLSYGYTLQRLAPTGAIAPGWPAVGLSIGQVASNYPYDFHGFALDDSACFWRANSGNFGASAQMLRPDLTELPSSSTGWPTSSQTNTNDYSVGTAPATGGAYVAWTFRLQRMTRSGVPAAGWPATGVATGLESPAVQPDGSGGVVVFGGPPNSAPAAGRYDANAVYHAGWPAGGRVLGNPEDAAADPSLALLPSGPDHFIAGWALPYTTSPNQVKLQRFSLDGTVDPSWPAGGLIAALVDGVSGWTFIADGVGGAHVLWYANNRAFGTHVRSDGTFVPGLGSSGVDLAGADPDFSVPKMGGPTPAPFFLLHYVVADAAPDGGLVFACEDTASAQVTQYRVRWLNADYTPNPSEPAAGRVVLPTVRPSSVRGVHSDGVGGVYLAWEVLPSTPDQQADYELYMTRLLPSALVGVTSGSPLGAALSLSAPRPNPARGAIAFDVTLQDDSPARVELVDVAGRVVRSQAVTGAGAHAITFGELNPLSPGLYFARVTTRAGERSARVVLNH